MSSKTGSTGLYFTRAMTACILAVSAICAVRPGLGQTAPAGASASIEHGSDKARDLKEPSFQTREERLNAKPLDWNSTIGTPSPPHVLTDRERRALQAARPASSAGGKPARGAEAEARKLHPEDWN